MQKIRKTIQSLLLTTGLLGAVLFPVLAPAVAYAQSPTGEEKINQGVCQGTKLEFTSEPTSDPNCKNAGQATNRVNNIVNQIVNIFSVIVGIISVIMIVVGGFKYITSGGDTGKVTSAKNTILYAVVGLVVVALAQVLVKFVFAKAQGGQTGAGGPV